MRENFNYKLLFVLIFLFLSENYLFLNYSFQKRQHDQQRVLAAYSAADAESCNLACQKLIDEKINKALTNLNKTSKTTAAKTTAFIPLGSGGSSIERDWVVVEGSDFNFDLKDYSSAAKVYWQGNLKVRDLNSRCYARLYDKTHFRTVDFSEQSTNKTDFENLTSQALSIWTGSNAYRLEIKSLNGIPCYLESPKLLVKY